MRTVLMADDEPIVSKSFNRVLAGNGYAVIGARSGQEALDKLAAEEYDMVFIDRYTAQVVRLFGTFPSL